MNSSTVTPLSPPRITQHKAMLILGLSQGYGCPAKAGIPSQWDRFLPHFCNLPGQVGRIAYGVIYNPDDAGNFDYLCGVEVTEFPSHPLEFTRLQVPPQTYAIFEHREHISAIEATFKAIWDQGLAACGRKAADGPSFERYDERFDGRTGFGGLEIWVPILA